VFFSGFEVRRKKRYQDRYQLIGTTAAGRKLKVIFQLKSNNMSVLSRGGRYECKAKKKRKIPSEIEIDQKVISQANEESAWEKPVQVKRTKPASLSIPAELAARAAFLARLHREKGPAAWLTRIIRERVELEEVAFIEAKRDLAGNDYT
jgi:hypothetical protein